MLHLLNLVPIYKWELSWNLTYIAIYYICTHTDLLTTVTLTLVGLSSLVTTGELGIKFGELGINFGELGINFVQPRSFLANPDESGEGRRREKEGGGEGNR